MTGGQTILVLGGGIGGVAAANALRRRLDARHRIVVVDRDERFDFAPSFLWVMTGVRRLEQVSRPLSGLERRGIEVVRGEVGRVDPASRAATVGGRAMTADHLIVAMGAEFAPDAIPGLAEGGHTFVTLGGAERLRQALDGVKRGRVLLITAEPAYKCPAAPYEAAMLVDGLARRRGLRASVEIELHTAEPGPMGVAGPEVSAAVQSMVEAKGIRYHPAHQIVRVENRRAHFADGVSVEFDLLIYMPPIRPPRALAGSGLVDAGGWVPVDRNTLETPYARVWAVGDVTVIPLAMGKPLPKAGVFAHAQAEVVAHNIARIVRGQAPTRRFDGHGSCFVEAGGGKAGVGAGDFYAEPLPHVRMRRPCRLWHVGKVLFERQVMRRWI